MDAISVSRSAATHYCGCYAKHRRLPSQNRVQSALTTGRSRKGLRYGTLVVDLEHHCPIDLLPDRQAETVTQWLKRHPSIAIITRDRSQEYAQAATQGAPQAIQVADRWHLLKNLGDALQQVLERYATRLRKWAVPEPAAPCFRRSMSLRRTSALA